MAFVLAICMILIAVAYYLGVPLGFVSEWLVWSRIDDRIPDRLTFLVALSAISLVVLVCRRFLEPRVTSR